MTQTFKIPLPQQWINPDGSPTIAFYKFIYNLFTQSQGGGAPADSIQSNITAGIAPPVANTLTDILDALIGNTRGDVIVRGASSWEALSLGSAGEGLVSNGTDLVYAAIIESISGGGGVTASAPSGGVVTLGLSNALTLAAGTPASITTAGGDLLLDSFTHGLQLGTTAAAATSAPAFTADHRIKIKDGAGSTYYIAVSATPW